MDGFLILFMTSLFSRLHVRTTVLSVQYVDYRTTKQRYFLISGVKTFPLFRQDSARFWILSLGARKKRLNKAFI